MIEGRIGMFVVEMIARIRRAHFVQGKSIRRELRVSRKAVGKVIRSEATEFQYERSSNTARELGLTFSSTRFIVSAATRPIAPALMDGVRSAHSHRGHHHSPTVRRADSL